MTDEQMTGLCLKYENADDDFWEEYLNEIKEIVDSFLKGKNTND